MIFYYSHIEQQCFCVGDACVTVLSGWDSVLRRKSHVVSELDHSTSNHYSLWLSAPSRPVCVDSIATVRTSVSVNQAVVGRRTSVRTSSIRGPTSGGVAVSNLHGMTDNNQPTKTVLKYVISFCAQICTLTIIIIIIISLGIIVLNAAWKFMIKTLVHGFNPIFDVVSKIVKFIKMLGI